MNNLNTTKKKLTTIFTGIVLLIILILWLLFFSWKYFNEIRIEKINFSRNISVTEKRFETIEKFLKESNFRENLLKRRKVWNKEEIINIRNNIWKYLIIKKGIM